jgi:hypothetical protein
METKVNSVSNVCADNISCLVYAVENNNYSLNICYDDNDPYPECPAGLKIALLDSENAKLEKFIEDMGCVRVNEITDDVDYVIADNFNLSEENIEKTTAWCIPVISECGFRCRFGANKQSQESFDYIDALDDMLEEDIYTYLNECKSGDEYYKLFNQYGIGTVTRKISK